VTGDEQAADIAFEISDLKFEISDLKFQISATGRGRAQARSLREIADRNGLRQPWRHLSVLTRRPSLTYKLEFQSDARQ
jgi:hypothetical protein